MEEEKELPVPDLNMPCHVKAIKVEKELPDPNMTCQIKAMEEEKELPNLQPFDSLSSQSKAWTDEKHNAYLTSLEASFVKQLHHSLGLLSASSEQNSYDPSPSQQLPLSGSSSSVQCTAWINQKHNAYIASLEASFVKQLHRSLGLLSSRSEQNSCDPSPSQQLPMSGTHSCDQNRQ